MAIYKVEVRTIGRELYSIEDLSPEEAENNWFDGDLFLSEVTSYEVEEIWEISDEF